MHPSFILKRKTFLKHYLLFFVPFFLFFGCSDSNSPQEDLLVGNAAVNILSHQKVVPNQVALLSVEGMMCAKGCGSMIRKELYKIGGVAQVEVDFKETESRIKVHFDQQEVSAEKIIKTINQLNKNQYKATLQEITPSKKTSIS